MQKKFIHSVVFYRDGEQIPPEALKVGKNYHIYGIDDQTYEKVETEAKVINLYHVREIQVGEEIFGFSPKKYKSLVKFELKSFVFEKSKSYVSASEAKKLIPENIVYAVGTTHDKYVGKKDVYTSKVLSIFTRNGVMYFETFNTLYQCV